MKQFKIEKNIPLPSRRGEWCNDIAQILRKMAIGDSTLVDNQSIANSFRGVAPRYGMKITGRRQPDKKVRIWRIK